MIAIEFLEKYHADFNSKRPTFVFKIFTKTNISLQHREKKVYNDNFCKFCFGFGEG